MRSAFLCLWFSFVSQFFYAGFAPVTPVFTQHDLVTLMQLHKTVSIFCYDCAKNCLVDGIIYSYRVYTASHVCKVICDSDISFIASPNQIVKTADSWCAVKHLKPRNRLWCYQNAYVVVEKIQIITQETELIEISVEPAHTFFITSAKILAHNHPAIMITAAPLVTSIIPAAAKAVGVLGVASAALYSLFARSGNHSNYQRTHSDSSCSASPPPPRDPRDTDKYKNMEQVFEEAPIGRNLQNNVEHTKFSYNNDSTIYRAVRHMKEYGIKKGDWLYLDKMHGDHIEVFKRSGKIIRTVLNMDGTRNVKKYELAFREYRRITKWIK